MERRESNDDSPMTLREAAEVLLNGVVKASTLRAAIERNELTSERLGRVNVVTPRAIREWRERCRVPAKDRSPVETGNAWNGLSEAAQRSAAQAALSRSLERLKQRSAAQAALLQIAAAPTKRRSSKI